MKKDFLKDLNNSHWLFINTGSRDGAFNMACDEYLLDGLINDLFQNPILRLYAWDEPTVSLGINQKSTENSMGSFPVVRRISGGQAVFHGNSKDELTYSVFLPYKGSARELYKELATVFFYFLKMYNLDAGFGYSNTSYRKQFDCFLTSTSGDITVGDIKVIGSAQCRKCRKKNYILQHGAIKIDKINKISKKDINFNEAVYNLKVSFEQVLKINFLNYSFPDDVYEKISSCKKTVSLVL